MTHNIQEKLHAQILNQFLLRKKEALILVLLSTVLILFSIIDLIRTSSPQIVEIENYFENQVLQTFINTLNFLGNTIITADLATMILWAVVGFIVYMIFVFISGIVNDSNSSLRSIFLYSHPKNYDFKAAVLVFALKRIGLIFGISILILFGSTILGTITPYIFALVSNSFDAISMQTLFIVFPLYAYCAALHLWISLFRLLILLEKIQ